MAFKNYVVFYTKGDVELGNFLVNRAKKLGYKGTGCNVDISVSLDTKFGSILWTCEGAAPNDLHEIGNFEDFLTTDKYKYVPPKPKLMIGDYEVKFDNYYMTVECQRIHFSKVEEIIKAYKEHVDSDPF